jgi:hypothetical protein
MNSHKETFKQLLIRLTRLLNLYENAQPNETHLFNLLGKEIEKIRMKHDSYKNSDSRIKTLISKFHYPRELPKGEIDEIYDVEPFTLSKGN